MLKIGEISDFGDPKIIHKIKFYLQVVSEAEIPRCSCRLSIAFSVPRFIRGIDTLFFRH
jgi:hypothetical protein